MVQLAFLLIATLTLAGQNATDRPIRVYVFANGADDSGFVALDAKNKIDSANDLRPLLIGRKGKLNLAQVSSKSQADVLVEVTGREQDPKNDDDRVVHVRVTVSEYSFTIDGKDDDGSWRDAAKSAAKQLVKWLELNRSRITQREGA